VVKLWSGGMCEAVEGEAAVGKWGQGRGRGVRRCALGRGGDGVSNASKFPAGVPAPPAGEAEHCGGKQSPLSIVASY
jgi:hypothetical protein